MDDSRMQGQTAGRHDTGDDAVGTKADTKADTPMLKHDRIIVAEPSRRRNGVLP
jgi:hypothetical protein